MNETQRRQFLRAALAGAGLTLAGTAAGQDGGNSGGSDSNDDDGDDDGDDYDYGEEGLVTVSSDQSFDATVERLVTAIEANENLTLIETIDHAQNAESVDKDLRPTTLLLFGNPALGTELMQASQTAGIDLPQKLLVWETEDGSVNITYNDSAWLADRHDIEGQGEVLATISNALQSLATGER